ncbi:hypothetical protein LXL04_000790 [Taraxacum kok-saghyz]
MHMCNFFLRIYKVFEKKIVFSEKKSLRPGLYLSDFYPPEVGYRSARKNYFGRKLVKEHKLIPVYMEHDETNLYAYFMASSGPRKVIVKKIVEEEVIS